MGGGATVDGPRELPRTTEVEAEAGRAQTPSLPDAMAATDVLAVMCLEEKEEDAQPQQKQGQDEEEFDEEALLLEGAPDTIVCPISMVLMTEACVAGDGFSFNRPALQAWIEQCKVTGQVLRSPYLRSLCPTKTSERRWWNG